MYQEEKITFQKLIDFEIGLITGNFGKSDLSISFDQQGILLNLLQKFASNLISAEPEQVLDTDVCDLGMTLFPCQYLRLSETQLFSFGNDDSKLDDKLLTYVKQLILLCIGVSSLQLFLKGNVSGPGIGDSKYYKIVSAVFPPNDDSPRNIDNFLMKEGEFALPTITQKKLLALSILFLSYKYEDEDLTLTRKWWLARCLMIHQFVMPEKVHSLHNEIISLMESIADMEWIREECSNSEANVLLNVERAQMHLFYHEVTRARHCIEEARKLVGLDIELSGAYGKRTQFQQKAVAQLFIKLKRDPHKETTHISGNNSDSAQFPVDLHLQDDTLLNKVSFIDECENKIDCLLPEEQIVLLGHCCLVLKGEAYDELLKEEVSVYVNCLLDQPRVWAVYIKALIMRCKLEKNSSRRVERALMQLEAIIDCIKKTSPPFSARESMLFATAFPLLVSLEKDLADLWMTVGGTKSALAIYERIQSWQDMITCYQILGRTSCAEALIRERLEERETPLLLCLLGDVTNDPDMYTKAYELSHHTNARSQRSLAYYYYRKNECQKSIPFFNRTLEINPLQSDVWYSLGFAALKCEEYELAIKAYRQVVTLDQDNFEAWNNMANAYVKTHQKQKAWRCFSEALKCNYEEWKVWENFLVVSVDVGAFEDALRSWHRLLDIKGKYTDSEVLRILVRAINEDLKDASGVPSSRLRKAALQLLGRLSSAVPSDYVIWDCYASLQCPNVGAESDRESLERSLQYQQKAVRCCSQSSLWQKEFDLFKDVLQVTLRYADLSLLLIPQLNDILRKQQKSSSKLSIQTVLLRAQKYLENFQMEQKSDLEKLLDNLKLSLESILNL